MNDIWLAHHGILGQKWGVRRFQNKDGSYTSAGKKRYSRDSKAEEIEEDTQPKKSHKDLAKKIAIGTAIVAGVALASYGTYKLYKNGKLDPIIDKFRKTGENEISKVSGLGISSNSLSGIDLTNYSPKVQKAYNEALDLVKNMNPTGSQQNCGACAIMLDANERFNRKDQVADVPVTDIRDFSKFYEGFDFKKRTKLANPYIPELNEWMFDTTEESYSSLVQILTKLGDGASGVCFGRNNNVDMSTYSGNNVPGHFLRWKVIEDKVLFMDGQNGIVGLSDSNAYNDMFSNFLPGGIGYSQLNDLNLIQSALNSIKHKGVIEL